MLTVKHVQRWNSWTVRPGYFIGAGNADQLQLLRGTDMPKELWTAEQTAQFFGISKRALYQRVYRGQLPYIKYGGRFSNIRFDPDELQQFIDSRRVKAFNQGK